jgi:hypothetical protein
MNIMTTPEATKQLERSERGQLTCKLLLDFLNSPTVKYLDGRNFEALTTLVTRYALGSGADSCEVIEQLEAVIERNQWVNVPAIASPHS